MPVQYMGILQEYEQTRSKTSIFDTCHMGEFMIKGDCQKSGLDRIVTQPIKDMPVKSCRYGCMLSESGGVIDDLIVYRLAQEEWMLVVNGATTKKDEDHVFGQLSSDSAFNNISSALGKLDIQGPLAREVVGQFVKGIEKLKFYEFDVFDVLGEKNIVSRTGYTGELGYEIYFSWQRMPELWQTLLKNPSVKAAGLGARDLLRIEMCYSLYGHELDDTISPLEAGLEKFIDFEKDFIGREALRSQKKSGVLRKLVYVASQTRQSPRHGQKITDSNGKEIGMVTSGTFSPHLKCGIGIAFVSTKADLKDKNFFCGNEKTKILLKLASRPFYKDGSLKN